MKFLILLFICRNINRKRECDHQSATFNNYIINSSKYKNPTNDIGIVID